MGEKAERRDHVDDGLRCPRAEHVDGPWETPLRLNAKQMMKLMTKAMT